MNDDRISLWHAYSSFAAAVGPVDTNNVAFLREEPKDDRDVIDTWLYLLTFVHDNIPILKRDARRLLLILSQNQELSLTDFRMLCDLTDIAKERLYAKTA